MFQKDRIFRNLTSATRASLYDQIAPLLGRTWHPPDLVVYLQAGADVLSSAIHERGRALREVDGTQVHSAPWSRLTITSSFHFREAPLLVVNTNEIEFRASEAGFGGPHRPHRHAPDGSLRKPQCESGGEIVTHES